MRKFHLIIFFLTIFLLVSQSISAQPDWLKEVVENSKTASFDKDADVAVLLKNCRYQFYSSEKCVLNGKIVYKVLKPAGIDQTSFVIYISSISKLKSIKGYRILPGGSVEKLKKENMVEINMSDSPGSYEDQRQFSAEFYEVNPGDIIAYEYEYEEKTAPDCFHQVFTFQYQAPVVKTRLEVEIPKNWQLSKSEQNLELITFTQNENIYIWEGNDLTYVPYEPYMPSWKYVRKKIMFSCYDASGKSNKGYESWSDVARWAVDIYDPQTIFDESLFDFTKNLVAGQTTDKKIKTIADYVQNKIRYVAVEIGTGRFIPRPAHSTFANKYGDCKDKATLMRTMLKIIGIPSYPVLAMTEGKVYNEFPSPFQFNHCIIAIETDSLAGLVEEDHAVIGNLLYFDPTDQSTPLGLLPSALTNSKALNISSTNTMLTKLPKLSVADQYRYLTANVVLSEKLTFQAEIKFTYHKVLAEYFIHFFSNKTQQELSDYYKKSFVDRFTVTSMDSLKFTNYDDSITVEISLKGKDIATAAGNMTLLKTDIFHDDRKNIFKKKTRLHPLRYGSTNKISSEINWTLPDSWRFEESLKPVTDSCLGANLNFSPQYDNNHLKLELEEIYYGKSQKVEDYKSVKKYDKARRKIYNARAVIIK